MITFPSRFGRDSVGQISKRLGVEGEEQEIGSRKRNGRFKVLSGPRSMAPREQASETQSQRLKCQCPSW